LLRGVSTSSSSSNENTLEAVGVAD
jgi:hypothetical protein